VDYFIDNFSDRVAWVAAITAIALIVAAIAASVAPEGERMRRFARVSCAGAAACAAAATTTGLGDGGGFVWGLGDGGLNQWSDDLRRFPDTIQSVLLVGNVVLYIPLGLFAAVGWPERRVLLLGVALGVPIVIEALQAVFLRGVGSLDDVVLNVIGVLGGWLIGTAIVLRTRALTRNRDLAAPSS
jgi:hypothetical protein